MPIVAETAAHADAIETLLDTGFGPTRRGKTVYRLREGRAPVRNLCFVWADDGAVGATIRYWPVEIAGCVDALLLGPIAVAPQRQREGLGGKLIRHSLACARTAGHRIVLLVGDEPYYSRFGFSRALTRSLTLPGPVDEERFLGLELMPGALMGVSGLVNRPQATAAAPNAEADGLGAWVRWHADAALNPAVP